MKKIPVYLSEEEIKEILLWAKITEIDVGKGNVNQKTKERLEQELETFEE